MSNQSTRVERSAGGLVFQGSPLAWQVLVIVTHSPEGDARWQLPKGWINEGETPEVTAVREVREETGIQGEIIAPLDTIEYWFYDRRAHARIHKYVSFFLMRYISGQPVPQQSEVDDARWVDTSQALSGLAFENERRVLQMALEMATTGRL